MSQTSDQPSRYRPALLSLIMLAALLAGVLAAYLLSSNRSRYSQRGADIVGNLRSKALAEMWKSNLLQFYTISRRGEQIGWAIQYRTHQDRRFNGVELKEIGDVATWKYWQLNSDATAGSYEAGFPGDGGPSLKLTMDRKTVRVEQLGQSPPPEQTSANYLPLDTLPAAVRLIAGERTRAYFRMHEVSREAAVVMGSPRYVLLASYVTVELQYAGRRQIQALGRSVDADVVQLAIAGLGAESARTYYLDTSGTILKVVQGDLETNIATQQDMPRGADNSMQRLVETIGRQQAGKGQEPMPLPFGNQPRRQSAQPPRILEFVQSL